MSEAIDIALRLAGLFYLLASVLGLRAVAMDALLSHAIAAIAPGVDRASDRADRWRRRYLLASSIGIGWGAISLVAGLAMAAGLFVLNALGQLAYLLASPRLVDAVDPPEPGARQRSCRAFGVYAALSVLVAAAAWTGILRPLAEQPWIAAVAGGAALALVAYAAWLLRPMRRQASSGWSEPEPDEPDPFEDPPADEGSSRQELARQAGTLQVMLTPSWGSGGLMEAETGEPVAFEVRQRLLSQEARDLIADWLCLFREVADALDPRRCRLTAPDGLARLEALGRPIHDLLVAELGPDRVRFEPAPRPVFPAETVTGVDLMAEYQCHPVWLNEPGRYGCAVPETLGLSWGLARSLDQWALAWDESYDPDDLGGPSLWSEEQHAAHRLEGRVLAVRLAREFAETGRGDVAVAIRIDGVASRVSASDRLPPLTP